MPQIKRPDRFVRIPILPSFSPCLEPTAYRTRLLTKLLSGSQGACINMVVGGHLTSTATVFLMHELFPVMEAPKQD